MLAYDMWKYTLQWLSQQPMIAEQCFIFLNTLPRANESAVASEHIEEIINHLSVDGYAGLDNWRIR